MLTSADLENRVRQHIPQAKVKAMDMTGGGDHWQMTVEAPEFNGLSLVEQHQLIYKALGEWMRREVHALALTTRAVD